MDILLFILIGLAILLLMMWINRALDNLGRIGGGQAEMHEGELRRALREAKKETRLAKSRLATRSSQNDKALSRRQLGRVKISKN